MGKGWEVPPQTVKSGILKQHTVMVVYNSGTDRKD